MPVSAPPGSAQGLQNAVRTLQAKACRKGATWEAHRWWPTQPQVAPYGSRLDIGKSLLKKSRPPAGTPSSSRGAAHQAPHSAVTIKRPVHPAGSRPEAMVRHSSHMRRSRSPDIDSPSSQKQNSAKAMTPNSGKTLSSLMKRTLRKGVTGGYTKRYSTTCSIQQSDRPTPSRPAGETHHQHQRQNDAGVRLWAARSCFYNASLVHTRLHALAARTPWVSLPAKPEASRESSVIAGYWRRTYDELNVGHDDKNSPGIIWICALQQAVESYNLLPAQL